MSILAMIPWALEGEHAKFNPLSPDGAGGFIWTLVVFLISLPLIWKFVMGPISRALLERDARAEQAIQAAQKASSDAEKAKLAVEDRLAEMRPEHLLKDGLLLALHTPF